MFFPSANKVLGAAGAIGKKNNKTSVFGGKVAALAPPGALDSMAEKAKSILATFGKKKK